MNVSANLKRDIDDFKLSSRKISQKISNTGDIWKDENYTSLQKQMGELAKASRSVIENGERVYTSADKFFEIANEKI